MQKKDAQEGMGVDVLQALGQEEGFFLPGKHGMHMDGADIVGAVQLHGLFIPDIGKRLITRAKVAIQAGIVSQHSAGGGKDINAVKILIGVEGILAEIFDIFIGLELLIRVVAFLLVGKKPEVFDGGIFAV